MVACVLVMVYAGYAADRLNSFKTHNLSGILQKCAYKAFKKICPKGNSRGPTFVGKIHAINKSQVTAC